MYLVVFSLIVYTSWLRTLLCTLEFNKEYNLCIFFNVCPHYKWNRNWLIWPSFTSKLNFFIGYFSIRERQSIDEIDLGKFGEI